MEGYKCRECSFVSFVHSSRCLRCYRRNSLELWWDDEDGVWAGWLLDFLYDNPIGYVIRWIAAQFAAKIGHDAPLEGLIYFFIEFLVAGTVLLLLAYGYYALLLLLRFFSGS